MASLTKTTATLERLAQIQSLYEAEIDPSLRIAFALLGLSKTIFPSVLVTDTLRAQSFPYPAPATGSFFDFLTVMSRVNSEEPIDANMSTGLNGDGSVSLNLPVGIAHGIFAAVKITSSRGETDPPSTWSLSLDGFFEDGEAWNFPFTQFEYAAGNFNKGDIVVLVTKVVSNGPVLCAGRMARVEFPNTFLKNGAPNMVAPDGVTLTVQGADASQRNNIQIGTRVTDTYEILRQVAVAHVLGGARVVNSVASFSEVMPPKVASAVQNLRQLSI